jgi:hypothetical protein
MPRIERSVAFLTGMITAALYVIMLVALSQESYMRRDAAARAGAAANLSAVGDGWRRLIGIAPSGCPAGAPWQAEAWAAHPGPASPAAAAPEP